MPGFTKTSAATTAAALGAIILTANGTTAQAATGFRIINLVSDGSVPAKIVDPNLINPWGISSGPTTPLWVSDNGVDMATIYTGTGEKLPLNVAVPGAPTGQVFNGTNKFRVSGAGGKGPGIFLFAGEEGIISGWNPTVDFTHAEVAVDNSASGAVYKGLAIGATGGKDFLYAANFSSGKVEMYNSTFHLVKTFTDPNVAPGYAPFNVREINGTLYVTFALQDADKEDDVAGPGNGYVDAFSLNGAFKDRIVSLGDQVNSPWGLDIAPAGFGKFAGDLLVGNFGDGTISVFDPTTGAFQDVLRDENGAPIVEGDLWGLINGNGSRGGNPDKVYFTAGISNEAHGLLGSIAAIPEPQTWALMLIGVGVMGATLRRRRLAAVSL